MQNNLPECIPNKVKLLFFESQKNEWLKVLQTSEGGLNENKPEAVLHWSQINIDAKERIRDIEEKINFLKITVATS